MIDFGILSARARETVATVATESLPYLGLLASVALALGLHRLVARLLARLDLPSGGFVSRAVRRTMPWTRLAFVASALIIALSVVDLPFTFEVQLRHLVVVLFVVLIGWTAILLADLTSDIMLRHYRIDVEDNLQARRSVTQVGILKRIAQSLIVVLTISAALLTFEDIKQFGVSILASAGAAGIILGLAARPVLANLIAGIQIAITQPIRIDDVVIVENEWGWIEEIGSSFVTVRLWDWRRLIVPLSYFIEQPFQNWTRETAAVIGQVSWHVDYGMPVERMRAKLEELVAASTLWDGQVVNLQVVETGPQGLELRGLMSARSSPRAWDLRCEIREKMVTWLQTEYPEYLPRWRGELRTAPAAPQARPGPMA